MSAEKAKVLLVVFLAVLAVSLGETLLAKGMKSVGQVQGGIWLQLKAVLNIYVLAGTFLMMIYFGLYMLSLSWADLSFVLPLTALSFLFGSLLAKYYLLENVTPSRWIGTFVIMLGVIIVGLGESATKTTP